MAGPGDGMAAGGVGRGYMRASSADRDKVIEVLKTAFVHGRLTQAELGARVGQTLTSRTYGELAAVTADIPAQPTVVRPPVTAAAQARKPISKVRATLWAACEVVPITLLGLTLLTGSGQFAFPFILSIFASYVTAGTLLAEAWERRHERRRQPHGPASGAGGGTSHRKAPATEAGRLHRTHTNQWHGAEPAPHRLRRGRRLGQRSSHRSRQARRCLIGCAGR